MNHGQTTPEVGHATAQTQMPQLTRRHLDWVYCLCLRSVRDSALAEDVTQCVFMALLKKSGRIPPEANISGWLFKTARHCCNRALRNDNTRRRHELAAARMRSDATAVEAPMRDEELLPMLDEQVARLSQADRTAVLLRYYERRNFRDIGHALGISEEAAKKRVQRAVEKLRIRMAGRRMPLGVDTLAAIMAEKLVQPAPAKLATTILAHATHGTTGTAITAGQSKILAHMSLKGLASGKTALAVTGAVLATALVAAGIAVALARHSHPKAPRKLTISRATTYITRPLDNDGLPDYELALKEYLMKGVTPENNAAVPAIEIAMRGFRPYLGAKEFDYRQLGQNQLDALGVPATFTRVPRVHAIGSYFMHHPPQGYNLLSKRLAFAASTKPWWRAEMMEEMYASNFPWRPSQCLLLWAAISHNKSAIRIIRRASRLPHFYVPDFTLPTAVEIKLTEPGLGQVFPEVPTCDVVRPVGSDIAYQATLELGRGDVDNCLKDLQAVSRLVTLTAQCPNANSEAVARSLESQSLYGCRVLIERLSSHPHLAARAYQWFSRLPLWPILTERVLYYQRLKALRFLALCYGEAMKPGYHPMPAPRNWPPGSLRILFRISHPPMGLDWNWQFRRLNKTFDRLTRDVHASAGPAERTDLWHWLQSYPRPLKGLSGNGLYDRQILDVLDGVGLREDMLNYSVRRSSMLIKVGFALAAYNALHGRYPKTLASLVPLSFAIPPTDPLDGKRLIYRRTRLGYTLALNGAGPMYITLWDSGPQRIIIPPPAPTGWQKGSFP